MFPGELAFLFGQVRFPDGDHEAPVLAHGAALHPGHDQVQFLELTPGIQMVVNRWPWRHRTTVLPPKL